MDNRPTSFIVENLSLSFRQFPFVPFDADISQTRYAALCSKTIRKQTSIMGGTTGIESKIKSKSRDNYMELNTLKHGGISLRAFKEHVPPALCDNEDRITHEMA